MAYHIAVDSCTDMTAAMKKDEHITLVPLTLNVGEDKVIDDETFNQAEFLKSGRMPGGTVIRMSVTGCVYAGLWL